MCIVSSTRRHSLIFISLLMAVLFVLAACGTGSQPGGTGSSPTPTPPIVSGYGSANGCPSDAVVNTSQPQPNVTVKPNQLNSTITAHKGDVVEFDMPFGHTWGGPTTSQGVLQLQPPPGYASKAHNVCVWRFTAQGTGTTDVTFTSRALCKKGEMCPQYILNMTFVVNVK